MKTHQQRSPASEIEELYAIAVREHGPQGRSSRMLKQELERELRRPSGAGAPDKDSTSMRDRQGSARIHRER